MLLVIDCALVVKDCATADTEARACEAIAVCWAPTTAIADPRTITTAAMVTTVLLALGALKAPNKVIFPSYSNIPSNHIFDGDQRCYIRCLVFCSGPFEKRAFCQPAITADRFTPYN